MMRDKYILKNSFRTQGNKESTKGHSDSKIPEIFRDKELAYAENFHSVKPLVRDRETQKPESARQPKPPRYEGVLVFRVFQKKSYKASSNGSYRDPVRRFKGRPEISGSHKTCGVAGEPQRAQGHIYQSGKTIKTVTVSRGPGDCNMMTNTDNVTLHFYIKPPLGVGLRVNHNVLRATFISRGKQ
ncbi:hypothetical protein J6590_079242 [Homalodisca vitripennis]|nr:hypothetical protein J6590_079242 [Homalodisca vitripennis]